MTVVIIEDDDGMRESLVIMLDVHGFPSRAYSSAEAFLGDTDEDGASFLVVDHQLPGMTGVELIRRLAEFGRLPTAVLVSARVDAAISSGAIAAGATAVLEKPIEPRDLMDLLRSSH